MSAELNVYSRVDSHQAHMAQTLIDLAALIDAGKSGEAQRLLLELHQLANVYASFGSTVTLEEVTEEVQTFLNKSVKIKQRDVPLISKIREEVALAETCIFNIDGALR